jgi:hypothetical protein
MTGFFRTSLILNPHSSLPHAYPSFPSIFNFQFSICPPPIVYSSLVYWLFRPSSFILHNSSFYSFFPLIHHHTHHYPYFSKTPSNYF